MQAFSCWYCVINFRFLMGKFCSIAADCECLINISSSLVINLFVKVDSCSTAISCVWRKLWAHKHGVTWFGMHYESIQTLEFVFLHEPHTTGVNCWKILNVKQGKGWAEKINGGLPARGSFRFKVWVPCKAVTVICIEGPSPNTINMLRHTNTDRVRKY